MHRKILFRNKIASVFLRLLALFLVSASYTYLVLGMRKFAALILLLAFLFILCGVGLYVEKKRAILGIKCFFSVLTLLAVFGFIRSIGDAGRMSQMYSNIGRMITAKTIAFILLFLWAVSFLISLEMQYTRLKTPLDQLSADQKSDTPQRKKGLLVFIVIIVLVIVYFVIGKVAQRVVDVPPSYFEKTRVNLDLPDAENGNEQMKKLMGTTMAPLSEEEQAKYPFQYPIGQGGMELGGNFVLERYTPDVRLSTFSDEYAALPLQLRRNGGIGRLVYYPTYTDLIAAQPDLRDEEKVQTLENSDFFSRLEGIVAMEWRDDDPLPILQGIQGLERTMSRLSLYYAEKGEIEKAVALNALAIRLADKFFSDSTSVIKGLIAMVTFNLPLNTTEYLLEHYPLSESDLETLQATYSQILLTDKETVYERIFKGEYTMMRQMMNNWDIQRPEYIIGGLPNNGLRSIFEIILSNEPFYNIHDTLARYRSALKRYVEAREFPISSTEILESVRNQPRNLYNIVGSTVLDSLLPRLEGIFERIEQIYKQKAKIEALL